MAQSLDAAVWQSILFPDATGTFGDLPVGARFRFPKGGAFSGVAMPVRVYTKTSGRWFTDGISKFTTGKHSAVIAAGGVK